MFNSHRPVHGTCGGGVCAAVPDTVPGSSGGQWWVAAGGRESPWVAAGEFWRMFEDEEGLYIEDLRTKETSKVLFGKDLAALESQIKEQQKIILTLSDRVKKLEERAR